MRDVLAWLFLVAVCCAAYGYNARVGAIITALVVWSILFGLLDPRGRR